MDIFSRPCDAYPENNLSWKDIDTFVTDPSWMRRFGERYDSNDPWHSTLFLSSLKPLGLESWRYIRLIGIIRKDTANERVHFVELSGIEFRSEPVVQLCL